jgi:organic radical activating enzyme
MNRIDIAETFLSIQGEGKYAGTLSVFLRLSHCNLNCQHFSYISEEGKHLGCDSKHLWTTVHSMAVEQLVQHWQEKGWLETLKKGAHLVITGGEPLLQQTAIEQLITALDQTCDEKIFIEIETNATLKINAPLLNRLNQINASPKLTTSGNSRCKAYHLDVLRQLAITKKTIFKFVIFNKKDILEILHDYMKPLKISSQKIWLMPEGCTPEALQQKTPMILDWCKQYNMNYSPRLQIFLNMP